MKYPALYTALALLLCTTTLPAAEKNPYGTFDGKIVGQYSTQSNIGSAPNKPTLTAEDLDDEYGDEDELADDDSDDFMDDDILDDFLDDSGLDEQDLEEIDDSADEDGDGIDDVADTNGGGGSRGGNDGDEQAGLKTQLGHTLKLNKQFSWKTSLQGNGTTHNDRDDLNTTNWAAGMGPVWKIPGTSVSLNPTVGYTQLYKTGTETAETWLAGMGVNWKATEALSLTGQYMYQDRDITDDNGADVAVDALRIGGKYKLDKRNTLSLAFIPGVDDATRNSSDKTRMGGQAGYSHNFGKGFSGGLALKYLETDFDSVNRTDKDTTYSLAVNKKLTRQLFLGATAEHKNRDSSIGSKENHNNSVTVQAGWRF